MYHLKFKISLRFIKGLKYEKLQSLNQFGTYSIIIINNIIDNEVLITKKQFKTLETKIEKQL